MKIGFTGINIQEGKIKYNDQILTALSNKDKPKKISPFFVEFLKDEYLHSDAIVVKKDHIIDVLILDIDRIENRINKSIDKDEIILMEKCLLHLEKELPLCSMKYNESESKLLNEISPFSLKPVIQIQDEYNITNLIETVLNKTSHMFFYTSGPKETHAWLVPKGSNIVFCASKIHSDLARGFIKGDVVSFNNYMNHHNFNECKSKGVASMVDKDYIVKPNEIIEIRFNV